MALARSISNLLPVPTVDGIQFNLVPAPALSHVEGLLHWDDDAKTLEIDTEISGTHIQVGQEIVVRCTNKTTDDFPNGTVVIVNGAQGFRPTIVKAQANSEALSDGTLGICTHLIAKNDTGYVTTEGILHDLDTGAYTEGQSLYLSPTVAGAFTATEPEAPYHIVHLGYVLKAHSTEGMIYARIDNGWELGELHDVHVSGVVDNHILKYVAAPARWENSDTFAVSSGSFTGLTQGSVLFAGAAGLVSQDNAKLFWDNTNKRLGIGTAAPSQFLDVVGGNIQHKGQGHLLYQDIDITGLAAVNDLTGLRFSRNGIAALMGGVQFNGSTYTAPSLRNAVTLFNYLAAGLVDISVGAGINDTTRKVRIDANGNVLIGSGAPLAAGTSAVAAFHLKSGTPPTASIVDGVQFYSMDRAAGQAGLAIRNEGGIHHMLADRVGFGFASYADLTGIHTMLQVNGGVAEALVTKTTTYAVTINDRTVRADASAGVMSIVIMSPSGITGRPYAVTKVDGTVNQVRVQFISATCNGVSEFVLATQYAGAIFIADGTSNTWAVF